MEGGVGWLASLLDRAERDENYFDPADQPGNRLRDYLKSGRILLGCEGSEHSIGYLAQRVGVKCFAYASDYPHEVDLPAAMHEIEEVAERDDLSVADRQAIWRKTRGGSSDSSANAYGLESRVSRLALTRDSKPETRNVHKKVCNEKIVLEFDVYFGVVG